MAVDLCQPVKLHFAFMTVCREELNKMFQQNNDFTVKLTF